MTLGPTPFLDGNYAVFGRVTDGLDVAQQIGVGDVMDRVYIVSE
ncbi:MAG: peptidylprolyl isomerase [Blastocatellia bacterium]